MSYTTITWKAQDVAVRSSQSSGTKRGMLLAIGADISGIPESVLSEPADTTWWSDVREFRIIRHRHPIETTSLGDSYQTYICGFEETVVEWTMYSQIEGLFPGEELVIDEEIPGVGRLVGRIILESLLIDSCPGSLTTYQYRGRSTGEMAIVRDACLPAPIAEPTEPRGRRGLALDRTKPVV